MCSKAGTETASVATRGSIDSLRSLVGVAWKGWEAWKPQSSGCCLTVTAWKEACQVIRALYIYEDGTWPMDKGRMTILRLLTKRHDAGG